MDEIFRRPPKDFAPPIRRSATWPAASKKSCPCGDDEGPALTLCYGVRPSARPVRPSPAILKKFNKRYTQSLPVFRYVFTRSTSMTTAQTSTSTQLWREEPERRFVVDSAAKPRFGAVVRLMGRVIEQGRCAV